MDRNRKTFVLIISGLFAFIYFIAPILTLDNPFFNYLSRIFDSDLFIFSIGIYGGTSMYMTGTIFPYIIQILLFFIGWFILYKIIKTIYLGYRERKEQKCKQHGA